MPNWLSTTWSWLPSIGCAAAILTAIAALFILWIFVDCSFSWVAAIAGQDLRLRFLHDAHVRYDHRWEHYGPRLLVFWILAAIGTLAACIIILRLAFGGGVERGLWNVIVSILVAAIWIGLLTQYHRIWWIAFRRRVRRLLPAVKKAAEILQTWPTSDVFLPGLGNYGPLKHFPTRLLHADPSPIQPIGETVRGISRSGEDCLRFSINSYTHATIDTFRNCCIELRRDGWSPPPVSVTETPSPPSVRTVHHEGDFLLERGWYLSFYKSHTTFKHEPDPEIVAEVAKRPPGLRLPHRGGRFRARVDTPVRVWHLAYIPSGPFPMLVDGERVLRKGEVVRLDYEPDPSRSTHCDVVAEDYARVEAYCIDARIKKDRDYRGYKLTVSYVQLDTDFDSL